MRGQSLIETLLVVGVVLVALSIFVSHSLSVQNGAASAAVAGLPAFVENARTVAASTGDGATVTLAQFPDDGAGRASFEASLYRYRPNPGSSFEPVPLRSERFAGAFRASLGVGPIAVFISSSGTASFALWAAGSPALTQEPACAGPLTVVVAGDPGTAKNAPLAPPAGPRGGIAWLELDCLDARLRTL